MKTKLPFFIALLSVAGYAQAPIESYFGNDQSVYSVVTSDLPIDETASGADATWNFTNLTAIGESLDTNGVPTENELTLFPEATQAHQTNSTIDDIQSFTRIFSSETAGAVSIIAVHTAGFELNYTDDNAVLGTFPLAYGYSNTDEVSGTYHYGPYSGPFTGTVTTSVDAYGTLTVNDGNLIHTANATRLKTVQNLTMDYNIFTNAATFAQTTYSYYENGAGILSPMFRTSTSTTVAELLSVNETVHKMELFGAILLGTPESQLLSNRIQIAPNPVADVLQIQTDNLAIHSVVIADINGRVVSSVSNQNTIDTSAFESGMYFATISTDSGSITKKMVKR